MYLSYYYIVIIIIKKYLKTLLKSIRLKYKIISKYL